MKLTYAQYDEAMKYLEKIYDEYVKLNPQDLIDEQKPFKPSDTFISIDSGSLMEWDRKDCKLMYLFYDFHTAVSYEYDGNLKVSHLMETTDDGLQFVAHMYNTPDELEFEIKVYKVDA
ncbi:hypothetical protein C3744_20815 [Priestia megaterium]|uniref:Uncharacterized protein n=1 Tax=Priestia megaterium TaxID=1404 RepID=A0A3D8WXW9_PRIMG|nr:hypothetical protein [Priestia megaterium]MDH3173649.1 hypothetical protein [Priestia megaterium]RDZ11506.1 hypothetical protein C3744_20815 [Priestia megaterium]